MAETKLKAIIEAEDRASAKLKQIGATAQSMGKTFLAVGGVITGALGFAVKAASDAEVQMKKVDTILSAMGDTSQKTKDAIKTASDATLKLGFDNEEAALSITKLFQRTGNMTQAIKLNTLAMDLARSKNISLTDASKAIGMVLSGNTKILKELGVAVEEGVAPMDQLAQAQEKLKGQAQGFSETFQGQLSAVKETFGNLVEEVGGKLLPILTDLLTKMQPIIQNVVTWIEKNPELTEKIVLWTAGIGAALVVLGTLGVVLPPIIAAFTALGTVLAFIAANPIILIIGAIVALVAGLVWLWKNSDTVNQAIVAGWTYVKDQLFAAWTIIKTNASAVWDSITGIVKGAIDGIMAFIDKMVAAWNKAKDVVSAPIKAAGNVVKGAASAVSGAVKGVISKITGRADGGDVSGGTPYVVGERGPEMFVPNTSGRIIPNGGAGGITINMNGGTYLSESVAEDIGNKIISQFRRTIRI